MNFKYTLDDKRYHTFNYYLKNKYHTKVAKISLNAGFTCPNRDGKVGVGGCLFCSDSGSGDFAGDPKDDLMIQFDKVSQMMNQKWPDCKYIAYFQANTNTYGSLEKLKATFEPFVNKENVVGIDIATRPDCLTTEILDYLEDLSQRTDLWVELGLQTIHEASAKWFNRGYSLDIFEKALDELRKRTDVKWTFVSPAGDFQPEGKRTGKYILGGEELTLNSKGESTISYADYAIAMVDEAIEGTHIQERISVVSE